MGTMDYCRISWDEGLLVAYAMVATRWCEVTLHAPHSRMPVTPQFVRRDSKLFTFEKRLYSREDQNYNPIIGLHSSFKLNQMLTRIFGSSKTNNWIKP